MTSRTTLLLASLGSAVTGGLIGGAVVASLAPDGNPSRDETERVEAPAPESVDVTALETKLAELEGRLDSLGRQQRSRKALEQYAQRLEEGEGKGGGPAATGHGPAGGVVDAEDPVFELAVRSVLDRVDWERDEEERLVRAQRRSERTERQTALLTERLLLSPEQAQHVSRALNAQMDRFRALREDNPSEPRPATRSEWRERVDGIREQTEKDLQGVLDEKQLEGYRSFIESEGLGGPGAFGRPGRELRSGPARSAE